jgi:hypothetical protein
LDQFPELGWLESSRNWDEASGKRWSSSELHCCFSPDYHANRYQHNLYQAAREEGYRFSPVAAEEVIGLAEGESENAPSVFHQHWLKEIFSGRKADEEGVGFVESYFNALNKLKERGCRVLWTVHNLLDHDIDAEERELNLICLRKMDQCADLILVHSENTCEELEKLLGRPIESEVRVLKHSLYDAMKGHPEFLPVEYRVRGRSGFKFLMFGMLRPYKGGADLVRSFMQQVRAGLLPGAQLIIAGQVYDPELRSIMDSEQDISEHVALIDRRVSDTELASLCREADVAVFPYRRILISGSYYQAVTFGLPGIVPKIGMFKCETEDGVTALTYQKADQLGEALKRAYDLGHIELQAMGQRALLACEGQTQSDVSRQFHQLLNTLPERAPSTCLLEISHETSFCQRQENGVLLSFCIPVMNRLDDLKATLARNLEDNRESKGFVEFIVACFDDNDSVKNWIEANFQSDLEDEYLRFFQGEPLDFWHFGVAKSAFKDLMRGRIYASLDGDNFTGYRGGEHIIRVFQALDYKCIFHQFQGEWGDGTCGRVSMSREDYVDFGYDPTFLPRQWDEMDAMLSVLVQRRDRKYVCYEGKSIIDKSHPFRRYLAEHRYFPETACLPPDADPLYERVHDKAVGLHDNQYVEDDPVLSFSSVYNHLQSFFKNTDDDELKIQYVLEMVEAQRKLVEVTDPEKLVSWLLESRTATRDSLASDEIVILACVKNEFDLEDWYQYYKDLGVTRFFMVDDGSEVPVEEILPYSDVHVWRPRVGKFRYAKVFWMEALLARYCQGLWCLTVDADEFISLPDFDDRPDESRSNLKRTVDCAEKAGHDYFCGFLLDMVPAPGVEIRRGMGREAFDHYQYLDEPATDEYRQHNTVRWSYGDKADWAYAIDVRYQINGSLDSLRKFPIIHYREGMHLNQGFHDLIIDGEKRSPADLERSDLIPIKHYKLMTMLEAEDFESAKSFDAYHHETCENLKNLNKVVNQRLSEAGESIQVRSWNGWESCPRPPVRRRAT